MIVITKTYLVDPDLVDSIIIACLLLLIKADSNYKVCQWINASGLRHVADMRVSTERRIKRLLPLLISCLCSHCTITHDVSPCDPTYMYQNITRKACALKCVLHLSCYVHVHVGCPSHILN